MLTSIVSFNLKRIARHSTATRTNFSVSSSAISISLFSFEISL